jgi:imidazolonepropionase
MSELVTNDPAVGTAPLGLIPDGALIIEDGHVVWVGPAGSAPPADRRVDLGGRAVLPGWVDSHSRVVHGGDPAAGAWSVVQATRAVDDATLLSTARRHRARMLLGGTTCAETKTGYGLTVSDERRVALTAAAAGFDEITFFGARAVPSDDGGDADRYVDLVCGAMLDAVADDVGWVDVACAGGGFDEAQSRRVLAAGQRKGLGLRVHGDPAGPGAGVRVAVDARAAAVEHCTHLTDADIDLLATSTTVATLLPADELAAGRRPAPGRALLDAGAAVALASGCNPETSYTSSMNLVVALAVLRCGMTAAEAVHAATAGGAAALRRTDVGHLAPGARADIHVLDAPGHEHLVHQVGMPLTHRVFRHGSEVALAGA